MSFFNRLLGRSAGVINHSNNVNLFPKDVWPIAAIMGGAVTMATGTAIYIGSKPAAKWTKSSQVGHQYPFDQNPVNKVRTVNSDDSADKFGAVRRDSYNNFVETVKFVQKEAEQVRKNIQKRLTEKRNGGPPPSVV